MAIRGKRDLTSGSDHRHVFLCDCGSPAHMLVIWVTAEEEDVEFSCWEISIGYAALPVRLRLRRLWQLIRGYNTEYGWVGLTYADALRMRRILDDLVQRIEAKTTSDYASVTVEIDGNAGR